MKCWYCDNEVHEKDLEDRTGRWWCQSCQDAILEIFLLMYAPEPPDDPLEEILLLEEFDIEDTEEEVLSVIHQKTVDNKEDM